MSPTLPIRLSIALALTGALVFHTVTDAFEDSPYRSLDPIVDVLYHLETGYVTEPDRDQVTQSAIEGMISSLGDPYTSYLPPVSLEAFENDISGNLVGIGAEIDEHEGLPRIVTPLEDSPAWRAGILAGDLILEIDGRSTQGLDVDETVEWITGDEGTDVTLKVRHRDGVEQTITITRAQITVRSVRGFSRDAENQNVFQLDARRGIGYIRLSQFGDQTAIETTQAIEGLQAQGLNGLILDLRDNPGGLLDSAQRIADLFLPPGLVVVTTRGRAISETVQTRTQPLVDPDLPLVILVNEQSASASEILSGALKDHNRAFVVGTRTFGKGSVQHVIQLGQDLGALKMTIARYFLPSGRMVHRLDDADDWGVDPSEGGFVSMSLEQIRQRYDAMRDQVVQQELETNPSLEVTPQWIHDTLHDPQLAAGLQAIQNQMTTGDWRDVSEGSFESWRTQRERDVLEARLEFLQGEIDSVQERIDAIDRGDLDDQDEPEADETVEAPPAEETQDTLEPVAP